MRESVLSRQWGHKSLFRPGRDSTQLNFSGPSGIRSEYTPPPCAQDGRLEGGEGNGKGAEGRTSAAVMSRVTSLLEADRDTVEKPNPGSGSGAETRGPTSHARQGSTLLVPFEGEINFRWKKRRRWSLNSSNCETNEDTLKMRLRHMKQRGTAFWSQFRR